MVLKEGLEIPSSTFSSQKKNSLIKFIVSLIVSEESNFCCAFEGVLRMYYLTYKLGVVIVEYKTSRIS